MSNRQEQAPRTLPGTFDPLDGESFPGSAWVEVEGVTVFHESQNVTGANHD